jgi:DNA-binding CsgD family transcriptional regulator
MNETETMTYRFRWKGINLNKWEHEIMEMLTEGHTYKQICKKHMITFDTFFSLIQSIYQKLMKANGKEIANEFLYRVSMQAGRISQGPQNENIHINRHSLFTVFYNEQ